MTSEEIKQTTNLIDLVKEYGIKVNSQGFCCCPFHKEKTPSMKIYPNSNTYYCFGCGASGDVFKFIQDIEYVDFKTAFIRLGGTYEEATDNARMVANTKRERANIKREMKEQADAKLKKELSFVIEIMKEGSKSFEPFSDEWCICKNNLPILFEYWEALGRGEEINEVNVYRKCREIRCNLDIGR